MKYIKHPIPEEISDKGGASVQLVQKQTIPLDGAIDAAIEAHYTIGQKEFIRNGVIGTMKSMAAGVRRDGRPRSIEGFLTVFPVFKGPIDLEKGFDPAVNKVQIKARLLNELDLDISNWTFEDVTPGKKSFTLNTVKAGPVLGVYQLGETGNINGGDLPSTLAGEELRVHWAVEGTDKSGDIPAAKLSSDVSRIDIAADALAELASEEYDGKTIVFTVRGNFSSAKISAKLKYAAPPPKATATLHPTAIAALAGVDPFTEINRGTGGFYFHSDGHEFAEGETVTFTLEAEGLDEPDVRECTIAMVDGAPRVDNPFADPIHASLTGTVTFGNDAVEGEVAYVPEE